MTRAATNAKDERNMHGMAGFQFSARIAAVVCRALIVAIACALPLRAALADVRVTGSKDTMTVQAKNASLVDVIAAVNAALKVKVTIAPAVNIPITGTYSGPLRRVFARMLAGHDFIMDSAGDRMTIILATQASAGRRPAATNGAAVAHANAGDDQPNTSGVQGWTGGFGFKSPFSPPSK